MFNEPLDADPTVPEPTSLALMGLGGLGMFGGGYRKRRKAFALAACSLRVTARQRRKPPREAAFFLRGRIEGLIERAAWIPEC